MKIKTTELTGAALDWAVATQNGLTVSPQRFLTLHADGRRAYSSDWAHGGPIIEREQIGIECLAAGWHAQMADGSNEQYDDVHPLVVAMRCYVASKFGDEVYVPDELNP